MTKIQWHFKAFEALTTLEFHHIAQLRSKVFVVEQNCVYQDLDGKDFRAFHCFATDAEGQVMAYTRIFAPGDYFEQASIGRVVVDPSNRTSGLGRVLMQKSLEQIERNFGKTPVKIGAQKYLRAFYESLGFEVVGEEYLEDGIPHFHMLKP